MARGLSDLQKSVLKSGLEVEIKHRHSLWRKRLRRFDDTLPMSDIVALAGAGERTASAEVVASKTVKRLIERGLLIGDTCHWCASNKSVKLSNKGIAKARELHPSLSTKLDRVTAAAEARVPAFEEAAYVREMPEMTAEQIATLAKRATKAMMRLA